MVRLSGAAPLFVPTDVAASLEADRVGARTAHAGPATRGVVLNSPNNPTGAVVEPSELAGSSSGAPTGTPVLIFDETYDRFLYEERSHVSAASLWDEHGDRIIVTGAASKTFAMTGWRLGWAVAATDVVSAMASYQSHSTSNASSISQDGGARRR